MRDKNTSARLCAKNAGGAYVGGGVFAGHYGIMQTKQLRRSWAWLIFLI